MKAIALFQVAICNGNIAGQVLDGRVLSDINLKDEIFVVSQENILNFYHSGTQECIEIRDNAYFDGVSIKSILSYGKYWDTINAGMSAKIECECERVIEEYDVIFKCASSEGMDAYADE